MLQEERVSLTRINHRSQVQRKPTNVSTDPKEEMSENYFNDTQDKKPEKVQKTPVISKSNSIPGAMHRHLKM